jgi:hypothetical protein
MAKRGIQVEAELEPYRMPAPRETPIWLAVFLTFFGLTSCNRDLGMTDEELTRKLVGTWIADEMGGGYRLYGETDFHRDGVQSGNGVVHTLSGTTILRFSGDWSVLHGRLVSEGEMMKSSSSALELYHREDKIERITNDELILVDESGARTVRHRKF